MKKLMIPVEWDGDEGREVIRIGARLIAEAVLTIQAEWHAPKWYAIDWTVKGDIEPKLFMKKEYAKTHLEQQLGVISVEEE